MTPPWLQIAHDIRTWAYVLTGCLYLALVLRLAWSGAGGRYPWFFLYCALTVLQLLPWGMTYHKASFEALGYEGKEYLLLGLKLLVVAEAFWRAAEPGSARAATLLLMLLAAYIVYLTLLSALPPYGAAGNYFPALTQRRLAFHLALALLAWGFWAGARSRHGLILAAYLSLYATAGIWDYQIFARADFSTERARWIYGELAWLLPLRAACLVGWLRSDESGCEGGV